MWLHLILHDSTSDSIWFYLTLTHFTLLWLYFNLLYPLLDATWLYFTLLHSTTILLDSTLTLLLLYLTLLTLLDSTWLYFIPLWLYFTLLIALLDSILHSSMALLHSRRLYFTLLQSTIVLLDATWLYFTLLWLYFTLRRLYLTLLWLYYTLLWLYLTLYFTVCDSTWLYYTLLWLYLTLLASTSLYYGFTSLYYVSQSLLGDIFNVIATHCSNINESISYPSAADEAWYCPKHVLRSGWLCITSRPIFRGDVVGWLFSCITRILSLRYCLLRVQLEHWVYAHIWYITDYVA